MQACWGTCTGKQLRVTETRHHHVPQLPTGLASLPSDNDTLGTPRCTPSWSREQGALTLHGGFSWFQEQGDEQELDEVDKEESVVPEGAGCGKRRGR